MPRAPRQARRTALVAAASVVGLGACAGHATNADVPAPAPSVSSPTQATAPASASSIPVSAPPVDPEAPARASLLAFLAPHEVKTHSPLPRVLYTWTTAEQVRELRQRPRLLTRSSSPTKGPDFFQRVVAARAARFDAFASVLLDPRFRKARFAWPTAWPTLRGFPGESYGDHLVRVVLSVGALIIELDRSDALRVVDLAGKVLPPGVALDHPDRIAAVSFFNDAPRGMPGPLDALTIDTNYREVVLINESMIESWEVGTDAVKGEIERGRDLAERLVARAEKEPDAPPLDAWLGSLPAAFRGTHDDDWRGHYAAALALASPHYHPNVTELRALLAALTAVPRDEPLVHRVQVAFPPGPLAPMKQPPPPPRRSNGTF